MKRHSDNEALIVNYLLGALPEAELQRFELNYLGDETLFEELQEIEDELIDDYASGALIPEQSAQFEAYFLRSPERREKLEFARAMTEHALEWKKERDANTPLPSVSAPISSADSHEKPELPAKVLPFKRWSQPVPAWRQWGAIAAAVLIAVGSGALWLRNRELRQELVAAGSKEAHLRQEVEVRSQTAEQLQTEVSETKRENGALQKQLAEALASAPRRLVEGTGDLVVSSALRLAEMMIGGTRGGGDLKTKTLEVPANTRSVHLDIEVETSKYQTFAAVLQSRDEKIPPLPLGRFKAGKNQSIAVKIPADKLTPGDYVLSLSGVTREGNQVPFGKYYLKVVRP